MPIGAAQHGRRGRGIAERPIEFQSRYVAAFAGALPQRFGIADGDMAAPVTDKAGNVRIIDVMSGRGPNSLKPGPQAGDSGWLLQALY